MYYLQRRSQDLAGGGKNYFFSDLEICMSRSDMLGAWGHAPLREII